MPFYWEDPFIPRDWAYRKVVLTLVVVLIVFVVLLLAAVWEASSAHAATAHFCTLRKIGGSWVRVCR